MLLYNIVLGNQQLTPDPWSHIIDTYGNHFIAKEDIRQRIRIDNTVDPSIYPAIGELTPEWSAANMQCYNILPGTRWANNNRNMNPLLLINKDAAPGTEQIVVYVTVSNNYSIVRFNTKHRILQTYHKKDTLQGCAIVLNADEREVDNRVIGISVYDRKKDQYTQFNITFMKEDLNKIKIYRKAITDDKLLSTLKDQIAKFNNRFMGFKIITKPNDLLTATYIVSNKFKDMITNATSKINNPTIITLDQDMLNDPNYVKACVADIQQKFADERIRAITQCGVNLPLDIIRELKLLYIFNYDIKNNVLSCK